MLRNLDAELSQFIKEERYFNYKRREYTMLNCLKKTMISVITNVSNINNIKHIYQGKK